MKVTVTKRCYKFTLFFLIPQIFLLLYQSKASYSLFWLRLKKIPYLKVGDFLLHLTRSLRRGFESLRIHAKGSLTKAHGLNGLKTEYEMEIWVDKRNPIPVPIKVLLRQAKVVRERAPTQKIAISSWVRPVLINEPRRRNIFRMY